MARRQISDKRKAVYYAGIILAAIGFLSFGSVFISGAMHFGDFSNFEARGRSMAIRAVLGMGMMIFGAILASVGRAGAAGSGIILDPEKAREDVEPWSRMTGGVIKDALDEAGISIGEPEHDADKTAFDDRLRRLHKLREEGLISEQEYEAKKKQILDDVK